MENQQQRQKEARGRNAVHSKRREGLVQVTLLPRGRVASRQASWGVISDLWGDLASRVQEQAFDGKKGGRLPSRLDCFAPTVGVSAGWIAERTRKITVKGQMRGSYAQIHAGNLSSWVPLYSPCWSRGAIPMPVTLAERMI
jgi:hypothetical protein